MSTSSTSPNRTLRTALTGCGVIALGLCLLGALGLGGYYFLQPRNPPTAAEPAVEYVLDASPRMTQPTTGGTRLEVARAVLAEVVRPADNSVTAGLRAFGSGAVAAACKDTRLLVPLAPASQSEIADSAFTLNAGSTSDSALAEAMVAAIRDLAVARGPLSLVVITGGVDSCNAQAGQLIKQEADRAGIEVQEFVIGFAVDPSESQAVKSMVDETLGAYFDAPDSATLRSILLAIQNYIDRPSSTSLAAIQTAATPGAALDLPAPSALPSDTPRDEATASPEATVTSQTEYVPQTACDHPYDPLRPGATWTYKNGDGSVSQTIVSDVQGDMTSASAILTTVEYADTARFECDASGISSPDFNAWNIHPEPYYAGPILVTEERQATHSGVLWPPAELLTPGYTWSESWQSLRTLHYDGFPQTDTATDTVIYQYTVTGAEPVTFNGKTYDGLQISWTGSADHLWSFEGETEHHPMSGSQVLARGIGTVQTTRVLASGTYTSVLTDFYIP